jgi:uncharacterized protein
MLRQLSAEESLGLLRASRVARLGCLAEGWPYVVPVNYIFDGETFYVHSLPGLKVRALRADPRVCLQVDRIEGEFGWESVIAYGRYEEVESRPERERAMQLLLARFPRLTPVESLIAGDTHAPPPVVFRVRVERVTGVREG